MSPALVACLTVTLSPPATTWAPLIRFTDSVPAWTLAVPPAVTLSMVAEARLTLTSPAAFSVITPPDAEPLPSPKPMLAPALTFSVADAPPLRLALSISTDPAAPMVAAPDSLRAPTAMSPVSEVRLAVRVTVRLLACSRALSVVRSRPALAEPRAIVCEPFSTMSRPELSAETWLLSVASVRTSVRDSGPLCVRPKPRKMSPFAAIQPGPMTLMHPPAPLPPLLGGPFPFPFGAPFPMPSSGGGSITGGTMGGGGGGRTQGWPKIWPVVWTWMSRDAERVRR